MKGREKMKKRKEGMELNSCREVDDGVLLIVKCINVWGREGWNKGRERERENREEVKDRRKRK